MMGGDYANLLLYFLFLDDHEGFLTDPFFS